MSETTQSSVDLDAQADADFAMVNRDIDEAEKQIEENIGKFYSIMFQKENIGTYLYKYLLLFY